jgi:tRNA (guanine-N7-)-methyltransferase
MGRALKYDIPGDDWRRGLDEVATRGFEAVFAPDLPAPLRLVVEIGFGRGEFLLDLAAKHPDTAFVGIEVSFKRVLKMARRLARSGLRNVRLVEGRGQLLVEQVCPPGSVDAFWINFSDPWPKDRHAGRRLFQAPFVASIARALAPGGSLHVATDDGPYAEQISALLEDEPRLENDFVPERWRGEVEGRICTGYEETWRAEGRALHFFEYRRRPEELGR